ncbi:MAG TPA: HU family DNA-binding protein [Bacillota bacterium]|nr:HU family DNA-binding protein [Bacillota bacterium]
MNKADLTRMVASKSGLTRKDAGEAIDATFSAIRSALMKGQKVTLVGFGGFEVRQRKARAGRNPQTGKPLRIKARKVPVFRAGKPLKEAINH